MTRTLVLLRTTPDTLLERISRLSRHQRGFQLAVLGAASVHAALVSLLSDTRPERPAPFAVPTGEFVIDLPAPEPSPEPPPEPPAQMPNTEPVLLRTRAQSAPAPEAREASRAAAVLSRSEDSEQPLDFTDSIVTGTATSYAGGITEAAGAGHAAARSPGSHSAPGSIGTSRASAGSSMEQDLSRAPSVLGGLAWNCPFPPAADVDGVDHAQVAIRVEVDANGRPLRVLILSDPGHGFAGAARACALGKRWTPGADRFGRASASGINLNVRFVR